MSAGRRGPRRAARPATRDRGSDGVHFTKDLPPAPGAAGEERPEQPADSRPEVARRGRRRPEQTRDDTDAGWGEGAGGRSEEWYREQRPPHWE